MMLILSSTAGTGSSLSFFGVVVLVVAPILCAVTETRIVTNLATLPPAADQHGDRKTARHLVLIGALQPGSRWQYVGDAA
jgi:hypothetical protein